MTKEKTARLIPNAIQVCTDTEKVKPGRMQALQFNGRSSCSSVIPSKLRLWKWSVDGHIDNKLSFTTGSMSGRTDKR